MAGGSDGCQYNALVLASLKPWGISDKTGRVSCVVAHRMLSDGGNVGNSCYSVLK